MNSSTSLGLKLSLVLFAAGALFSARADTTLTFDSVPAGVTNAADNPGAPIVSNFGSAASASSAGIVVNGAGTPDINLTWGENDNNGTPVSWNYYVDSRWNAVQMYNSFLNNAGSTTIPHTLTFTPTGNNASVILNSFNMISYWSDTSEVFTYTWEVVDANTLALVKQGSFSFNAQLAAYPVTLDVEGQPDEPLTLEMFRTQFSPDGNFTPTGWNIAMTQINFDEAIPEPGVLSLLAIGAAGFAVRRARASRRA